MVKEYCNWFFKYDKSLMGSSIFSWEVLLLQSKTIQIDGIGRVLLERSKLARRLNISLKPFAGVRVAVPYGLSFESAEKMALSKANWIKRHLDKVKEIAPGVGPSYPIDI